MKRVIPTSEAFGHPADGTAWIMDDVNAAEIMHVQFGVSCTDYDFPKYDATKAKEYKRILVERPGGFGDLIFANPVVTYIKSLNKRCKIDFCVAPRFKDGVKLNKSIDNVVDYPMKESDMVKYDAVLWLENLIELKKDGREMHCVDLFLKEAGVDPETVGPELKRNALYLSKHDKKAAKRFPRTEKKRVGIQLRASARCRSAKNWDGVIDGMAEKGWEVYLFGAPDEVTTPEGMHENVTNLTKIKPSLSFLESAAVIETCDIIIAPDSGLLHVAAAMDVTAMGVFAAFRADLRCKYSPKTECLQVTGGCAPCFWHGRNGGFPHVGDCVGKGTCPALDSVGDEEIINKAIEWEKENAHS